MRLTFRLLSSVAQRRPFYVTTPIFYVNAAPHIGHLYSAVVADAVQRFEKLTNPDINVIFCTGTDEHGTKIQQAAAAANLSLPQYCADMAAVYRNLFREFDVEYTDFIRTTQERHKKAVKYFWKQLVKQDCIYKAQYSGWYSVNDEAFVPEAHTRDEVTSDGPVKVSAESGHRLQWTEETNYMFRLSAFRTHLTDWLRTDGVIQPGKYQRQLLDYLGNETYLPDISVSRPASRVHWAVRVPGDEEQSIYVWLDALINYLSAVGYPDRDAMEDRGRPWPADVQVVGKDILKFHGIYWPAFLMAAHYPPPRRLVCHAHWTVDGSKMSKSRGNVVSPRDLAARVTPQGVRYLLLREATMAHDANFSTTKLINVANSELADTLGNLAARCGGARAERPGLHAGALGVLARVEVARGLMEGVERLAETCHTHYSNYQFYKVADAVMQVLHQANLFFETLKPWELKKQPDKHEELDVVLHITLETLRICGIILQPIIPGLSKTLLDRLQIPPESRLWKDCEQPSWTMKGGREVNNIQGKFVLFQRIYTDKKSDKVKKASA